MLQFQQTQLIETLQKKDKTVDDASIIYTAIQRLSFFRQFSQYLKSMDLESILLLCQSFEYESKPVGEFVFETWNPNDRKYYVILSGQVAVISKKQNEPKSPVPISPPEFNLQKTEEPDEWKTSGEEDNTDESIIKKEKGGPRSNNKPPIILRSPTFSPKYERKGSLSPARHAFKRSGTGFNAAMSPKYSKHSLEKDSSLPTSPSPEILIVQEEQPSLLEIVLEEVKEEPKVFTNLYDNEQFEEFSLQFGRIDRNLEIGESFGELIVEDPKLKKVSMICRNDCEFLVIPKRSFELVFNRKEYDKEFFMKDVFPLLTNELLPLAGVASLLNAFKLETFSKGSFLTIEGNVAPKDAKLYVIYKGECLIEKTLSVELLDNQNRTAAPIKHVFAAPIAVIGNGMLVGEEIMVTKNEYNYNVKVLSDKAQVYSITTTDLRIKSFKDFDENILSKYETKKKQREIICEEAKKEFEVKMKHVQNETLLATKHIPMKHLIRKPALIGLTKHIQRENKTNESGDSPSNSFCLSPQSPILKSEASAIPKTPDNKSAFDFEFTSFQRGLLTKTKDQLADTISNFNLKDGGGTDFKLENFEKASPKHKKNWSYQDEWEHVRLFSSRDPKRLHQKKVMLVKTLFAAEAALANIQPEVKADRQPFDLILRGHVKGTKRYRFISPDTSNIMQPREEKNLITSTDAYSIVSPLPSVPTVPTTGGQRKRSTQTNTLNFPDMQSRRTMTAYSGFITAASTKATQSPHQEPINFMAKENRTISGGYTGEESAYLTQLYRFNFDETEKTDYNTEKYLTKEISPIKALDPMKYLLNFEPRDTDMNFETRTMRTMSPEGIGIVGRNLKSRQSDTIRINSPEPQKTIEQTEKFSLGRLHTQPKPVGTRRETAREVRKKLFQKPPRGADQQVKSIITRKGSFISPLVSPKFQKQLNL